MFRIPVVCLLMLVQLVAGSGRATYLCISSDGKISGIDSGPLFCTNCHHEHDSEATETEVSGCESGCCDHSDEPVAESSSSSSTVCVTEDHDCDCEHKLISSEMARSVSRAVGVDELNVSAFVALLQLPLELSRTFAVSYSFQHYAAPPDIPDSTVVLSTIIIRS